MGKINLQDREYEAILDVAAIALEQENRLSDSIFELRAAVKRSRELQRAMHRASDIRDSKDCPILGNLPEAHFTPKEEAVLKQADAIMTAARKRATAAGKKLDRILS